MSAHMLHGERTNKQTIESPHPPPLPLTPRYHPHIHPRSTHHQTMPPKAHSRSLSPTYPFSKTPATSITLVKNHGISGGSPACNNQAPRLTVHEPFPTKICARRTLISRIPLDTQPVLGGLGENIASGIEVLGLGWVGWLVEAC